MRDLPDCIDLDLPDDWTLIPTSDSEVASFVRYALDSMRNDAKWPDGFDSRRTEVAMETLRQSIARSKASFAAGFVGFVEEQDDEIFPVVCSVVSSTLTRGAVGTDMPLLAPVLLEAYSNGGGPLGETEGFAHIEPPSIGLLGSYEALRLVRLHSQSSRTGGAERQFVQTFMIPVADGDGVIVLQFSTINTEYAKEFSVLFERIASSVRILYPSDPTNPEEEAT